MRFVTRIIAMKTAFKTALPRSSIPGSSARKYWVNATGKTARENHSARRRPQPTMRSEEHTSELQSQSNLVCRLLLDKKKKLNDVDYNACDASHAPQSS